MAKFIPRPQVVLEIGRTPEMAATLLGIAESIAEVVRQIAPVGTEPPHYRDQITVDSGVDITGAIARVNANDYASGLIEYGSVNNPAYAPLRRAAETVVGTEHLRSTT